MSDRDRETAPIEAATDAVRASGFAFHGDTSTGRLLCRADGRSILLEARICERSDLAYVDYTSEQNLLMHRHGGILRFLVDTLGDVATLEADLAQLLEGDWDTEGARRYGPLRGESHPDPTPPEEDFEQAFAECFGESALFALRREYPAFDLRGSYRPVDYVLQSVDRSVAIELNGERFHHPAGIGADAYRSQLLKQNSLVALGMPVLRWSRAGMRDRERFFEELRMFLGDPATFASRPAYTASRPVATVEIATLSTDESRRFEDAASMVAEPPPRLHGVELQPHQVAALDQVANERASGRDAFLVSLPTGTGKTEVAIADFRRRKAIQPDLNGLFLVPTRQLRADTLDRLRARLPELIHSEDPMPSGLLSGFTVNTYAQAVRRLLHLSPDAFGYVAVDEAHHAMAPGLSGVVRHFAPKTLLGLTATPERFDQKQVSEIFGSFETALSLEDAIRTGVVPPIRVFRILTNVDLSEVRFRGRDYVAADLQRSLVIPSRDRVVAEVLARYFGPRWQGGGILVFCVSVDHAQRMAKAIAEHGFRATAVSGRNPDAAASAIAAYRRRELQVLCACSMLSEGFDAPETSVVVMARPTLSKALYTQQLGRGTRWADGKEALYVLDVVDRYGPLNAPWTAHALFGVTRYLPFANVLGPGLVEAGETPEQQQLVELLEYERRIEEIDLFTFERAYDGHLSDEQMARELFITTNTLRSWVRKGEVRPRVQVPFGRSTLNYYGPEQVGEIRAARRLTVHDESTQVADFRRFIEERDYTFSYKPVLLLSLLTRVDSRGGACLEEVLDGYIAFYRKRVEDGLPVEKPKSPMARAEFLDDRDAVRRSLLQNPFEKFERKRFLHHAEDLDRVEFALGIWRFLSEESGAAAAVRTQMLDDLAKYFETLGGIRDADSVAADYPLSRFLGDTK